MRKKRNVIRVEVDLDAIPGFNHEPEDMVAIIQQELTRMVPHYKPNVVHERVREYDPVRVSPYILD